MLRSLGLMGATMSRSWSDSGMMKLYWKYGAFLVMFGVYSWDIGTVTTVFYLGPLGTVQIGNMLERLAESIYRYQ
jgi:hypothetical protein